jgi:hypothetical protein
LNGSLQKVSVMVVLVKKMKKLVKLLCLLAELKLLTRFFFCFALEPFFVQDVTVNVKCAKHYTGVNLTQVLKSAYRL